MSVLPVPAEYNPHWVYFRDADGVLRLSTGEDAPISRRQALPQAFHRDGSVYVTRSAVVTGENSLYGHRLVGYPTNPEWTVNIDDPTDWEQAEAMLARARANGATPEASATSVAAHARNQEGR